MPSLTACLGASLRACRWACLWACLAVATSAPAQVGREFLLAWPETRDVRLEDPTFDPDAELILLAESEPVEVSVSAPGVDEVVRVEVGRPARVRLPRESVMTNEPGVPVARAIHAVSSDCRRFGVLLRVPGSGSSIGDDVLRALPVHLLGTSYRPVSYPGASSFAVVATVDGTRVEVSHDECPAEPLTLDRGEVLMHPCDEPPEFGDVTGALVTASEPVALVSGSADSRILHHRIGDTLEFFWSFRDTLLESPWPVSLWGRTYVHAPFRHEDPEASGDLLRLVAGSRSTRVFAWESDGERWDPFLEEPGDHLDLAEPIGITTRARLVDSATYLQGSAPYQVAAFTVGNDDAGIGDPSMTVLDPVVRWQSAAVTWLPQDAEGSIALVVPKDAVNSVRLDGEHVRGRWDRVRQTDFWWRRLDDLPPGEHRIVADEPFLAQVSGYLEGFGPGAFSVPAIAYSPGASFAPFIEGPSRACAGACITLSAPPGHDVYEWEHGETGRVITVCPSEDTTYRVVVTDEAGCTFEAEHAVTVYPPPRLDSAAAAALLPCPRAVEITWPEATWRPGSPGGVYNVYRREGESCADDGAWLLLVAGLSDTSWVDRSVVAGVRYTWLVEAEDAPAGGACSPGAFAGGPASRACALPPGVMHPGDPDEDRLVSLSPWLRAVGYEREGVSGPATAVTFEWSLAPDVDPATHVEAWRGARPFRLVPVDVSVPGTTWRDGDAGGEDLWFYKVFNATECGSLSR